MPGGVIMLTVQAPFNEKQLRQVAWFEHPLSFFDAALLDLC